MRTCLVALLAAACGTTDPQQPATPGGEVAPFGVPAGTPTTMTLTPAGGTMSSSDGVLTLAFPPNAVAAPLDVTIQPVTNTGFSAASPLAYELSPNDVEFAAPVTITLANTEADFMATGEAQPIEIALQDAAGYWHAKTTTVFDAATGAVRLDVTTFGVPALATTSAARVAPDGTPRRATPVGGDFTYRIAPAQTTVALGTGTATLYEVVCSSRRDDQPLPEEEILASCHPPASTAEITIERWTIFTNSLPSDGTLSDVKPTSAIYHAPSKDPGRTIQVWAHFHRPGDPQPYYTASNIDIDCPWFFAPGATCTPPVWKGTSHVANIAGSVVDATFTFAPMAGSMDTYEVQSGEVTITQPPPDPNCTIQIAPANHSIATNEGTMKLTTQPDGSMTIMGQGTTVWLATYTTICPNGTGSGQYSFAAFWWPLPPGGPSAFPVTNNMASFDVSDGGSSAHIEIGRVMAGP